MKIKKMLMSVLSVAAAVAMTVVIPVSAVTSGYSDYGKSDQKTVVADVATTLTIGSGTSAVSMEIPANALPSNVTSVAFEVQAVDSSSSNVAKDVAAATAAGYNDVQVLDINLIDQDGNHITSLNGNATISVPMLHNDYNTVLHFDGTNLNNCNATVNNGFIQFQTNHFSYYMLAKSTSSNNANNGNNANSNNATNSSNPTTGDTMGTTLLIIGIIAVVACGAGIVTLKMKKSK